MTITPDQQQAYHRIIQNLYGGVVDSSPEKITQEVIDVVNSLLNEAIECSKALAITQQLLDFLYPSGRYISLVKEVVEAGIDAIIQWAENLSNNRLYQACLNRAMANWRTSLELALMGV